MAGRKRKTEQTDLFPDQGGRVKNEVSAADYQALASRSRKRAQPERALQNAVMTAAFAFNLPCIHVEYYCGNKFWALCPKCTHRWVVQCNKRINTGLTGHYDILGISWAIETKHKINKGRQQAKTSAAQGVRSAQYEALDVPSLVMNEADDIALMRFLREQYRRKYGKEPRI